MQNEAPQNPLVFFSILVDRIISFTAENSSSTMEISVPLMLRPLQKSQLSLGKGQVFKLLDGVFYKEAFHAPHFEAKILSVGVLTSKFNILFTKYPPVTDGISTCLFFKSPTDEKVLSVPISDDVLYRFSYEKRQ